MYTLYRDGDSLNVRRVPSFFKEDALAEVPLGARQVKAPQVDYGQWKMFTDKGRIVGPMPDNALLESWKRCKEHGVDHAPTACRQFTDMRELEPFAAEARELARDIETELYEIIRDKQLLFAIIDPQGRIARSCGDIAALRNTYKLNFGPGAFWTEGSVGTNAIGMALATGKPMQVFGEEHYCQSHHTWSCTAVPILTPQGGLWGCIDISGPVRADHSKSFGLLFCAAREMERRLANMHLSKLENTFRTLLTTVFNSVLTGMLSVDAKGRISSANNEAEILLGKTGMGLRGRNASLFFDYDTLIAGQKSESAFVAPATLKCHVNPDLIVRAAPLFSPGGMWTETVVTISEPQRIRSKYQNWASPGKKAVTQNAPGFEHLLHQSEAMRRAVHKAANAARTPSTVLLTGESGTGKELFARGIHKSGPRKDGPFVAVNCGAFAEELVQSELFGYVGGAFTGADRKGRVGKFELAHKGVLFLDEISEMPLAMQVNLLRALEEREIVPVGGSEPRPVDVKVIAATNQDLAARVKAGLFREDLFYRINVVGIHVPPLRERPEDVGLLAEHHARRLSAEFGLDCKGLEPEVLDALRRHNWPGNVRELVNCVEYAVNNMSGGMVRLGDLPPSLVPERAGQEGPRPGAARRSGFKLQSVEADTIREALRFHGGNISKTAKALGIGRNTLYTKLEKFNIAV